MFTIEVGKPYIPGRTSYEPGTNFNFTNGEYQLILSLENLKKIEKKSVIKGKASFKIFTYRNILFLLYKFNPAFYWSDCPYHVSKVLPENRIKPQEIISDNEGIPLQIFLINSNTGIVEGLRIITLNNRLSKAIVKTINYQFENPIIEAEYHERIDNAYRFYPTVDSMIELNLRD